jgi:hypothetical protein
MMRCDRRRVIEPGEISRAADHVRCLELIENEIAPHVVLKRAKHAHAEEAGDAHSLDSVLAGHPVQIIGFRHGIDVTPDCQKSSAAHVRLTARMVRSGLDE